MDICSFCEQELLDLGLTPLGATLPWPPLSDAQKSEFVELGGGHVLDVEA